MNGAAALLTSRRSMVGCVTNARSGARLPWRSEVPLPIVTAHGRSLEVERGTKLVTAIERLGIDIGHRCGGHARCTTCRVEFVAGESALYTRAEYRKLHAAGLLGSARLSCQILVEDDLEVVVLKTLQSEGWTDTGPAVADALTPDAERLLATAIALEASVD